MDRTKEADAVMQKHFIVGADLLPFILTGLSTGEVEEKESYGS